MDVLYLWYWLKKRPEALSSARGGMYEEDEFDSLSSSTPTRERRNATPSKPSSTKKRPRESLPSRRTPNKKYKADSDSMEVLVTLVGRIAAARGSLKSHLQENRIKRLLSECVLRTTRYPQAHR
ncbi:hypothetical protein GN244_ATG03366 [Phytophthora infestans]|uniref:Uncharacterized protein n=1 Tax=Phytophthora infestans TaxID=4787 RepID=A0A833SAH2_PHYIN|nr:hypothetical protein GN244_ATG03366 [Phytophthora infestans]KAF4136792.1 hypothetical protein GN958_ATG14062 [Phytophthora infestans]